MTNCPQPEQLLESLLAGEMSTHVERHVRQCSTCCQAREALRELHASLLSLRGQWEAGHDAAREEVLRHLEGERISRRLPGWGGIIRRWGGLTMRERTALGGLAAAACLAIVFLWVGNTSRTASATDRMAQGIRTAKSCQVTLDFEMQLGAHKQTMSQSIAWLAPRSYRMEFVMGQPPRQRKQVEIYPTESAGIEIDLFGKSYRRKPARRGQISPLLVLDQLGQFAGQTKRELGEKTIAGRQARGFELDAKQVDPDGYPGLVEIWLDAKTDLPVLVRYAMQGVPQGGGTVTMRDFRWNEPLEARLFDTTPPADFKDLTPEPIPRDEQVRIIVESLRSFAELSGGHYPRTKVIYGDVVRDEMLRLAGFEGQLDAEKMRSEEYAKIVQAGSGFGLLSGGLFRENPDVRYFGRTVAAQDKDRVLLHWQLDGGFYQVIYGDLRDEVVSKQRLRELVK